jgi:hypothetical protein
MVCAWRRCSRRYPGNARVENVVMAAFDHVDGVDLHIAQMFHRGVRRRGPAAERRGPVEPLGAQPDASGVGLGECEGCVNEAGHGRVGVCSRPSFTMPRGLIRAAIASVGFAPSEHAKGTGYPVGYGRIGTSALGQNGAFRSPPSLSPQVW